MSRACLAEDVLLAVLAGDAERVEALLRERPDDDPGGATIRVATLLEMPGTVEALYGRSSPGAREQALYSAVYENNVRMTKLLCDKGTPVGAITFLAITRGDEEMRDGVLDALLEACQDESIRTDALELVLERSGRDAHYASCYDNRVARLLDLGVTVRNCDVAGHKVVQHRLHAAAVSALGRETRRLRGELEQERRLRRELLPEWCEHAARDAAAGAANKRQRKA